MLKIPNFSCFPEILPNLEIVETYNIIHELAAKYWKTLF